MVLEGIDGAGKTEQTRRLVAWLRERGERVLETREPTDGKWGQRYRAWACGEAQAEPEEVLRFFVEDRREHVSSVIRPALEAGAVVVCDRYVASTLAYQAAQGLDPGLVRERMEGERFPEPDLVLWLRLPVDQALDPWAETRSFWRLDHVLVSPPLLREMAGLRVTKETRAWPKPSDHVPVVLDLA